MRRRKLRWAVAGLAVALVVGGVFVLWLRPDRVTRANFDRLTSGMTRAEVVAILGPPGDYTTGPITSLGPAEYPPSVTVWVTDEGTYWVRFDGVEERVPQIDDRGFWPSTEPESPRPKFSAFGWRLRRLWRKGFPE
jgi:hypothetical protein